MKLSDLTTMVEDVGALFFTVTDGEKQTGVLAEPVLYSDGFILPSLRGDDALPVDHIVDRLKSLAGEHGNTGVFIWFEGGLYEAVDLFGDCLTIKPADTDRDAPSSEEIRAALNAQRIAEREAQEAADGVGNDVDQALNYPSQS